MSDFYKRDKSQSAVAAEFFMQKKLIITALDDFYKMLNHLSHYTKNLAHVMPLYGIIPKPLIEVFFSPHYDYLEYCYSHKEANAPYHSSKDLENQLQTSFASQRFKEFFTSSSFCTRNAVSKDAISLLDNYIAALEERKVWQEVYKRFIEVENSLYSLTGKDNYNRTLLVEYTKMTDKKFTQLLGCSDVLRSKEMEFSKSNLLDKALIGIRDFFSATHKLGVKDYIESISKVVLDLKSSITFTAIKDDEPLQQINSSHIAKYGANINTAISAAFSGAFLICVEDATSFGQKILYDAMFEISQKQYLQYRANCDKLYSRLFYKNHESLDSWVRLMDFEYDKAIKARARTEELSFKLLSNYSTLPDFIEDACTQGSIITPYPPESNPNDKTEESSDSSDIYSSEHNYVTIELQRNKPDLFNFKESALYVYLKDAEAVHEVDKNVSDSNNATNAHDKPSREYDLCMSRDNVEACPDNMPYKLYLMLKGLIDEGITNPANMPDKFGSSYSSFNNDHYLTYNNGLNIASYTLKFISHMAYENSLLHESKTLFFPETEEPESGIFNQIYDNLPSTGVLLTTAAVIAATSAIIKFFYSRPENEEAINTVIANKWSVLTHKLLHPTSDQETQEGVPLVHFQMRQAAEQALEAAHTADRLSQNIEAAGTPGSFITDGSFELAGDSGPHSPLPEH